MQRLVELTAHGATRKLIDPEPEKIKITSLDEKLVGKAVEYVSANIASPDLSVEDLASHLGMSRVRLYKKLKQITGKTPIEFIRVMRLKRAAQLLRESQLNVSEIAYQTGFNNPKVFSKYFKEEFGILPLSTKTANPPPPPIPSDPPFQHGAPCPTWSAGRPRPATTVRTASDMGSRPPSLRLITVRCRPRQVQHGAHGLRSSICAAHCRDAACRV